MSLHHCQWGLHLHPEESQSLQTQQQHLQSIKNVPLWCSNNWGRIVLVSSYHYYYCFFTVVDQHWKVNSWKVETSLHLSLWTQHQLQPDQLWQSPGSCLCWTLPMQWSGSVQDSWCKIKLSIRCRHQIIIKNVFNNYVRSLQCCFLQHDLHCSLSSCQETVIFSSYHHKPGNNLHLPVKQYLHARNMCTCLWWYLLV